MNTYTINHEENYEFAGTNTYQFEVTVEGQDYTLAFQNGSNGVERAANFDYEADESYSLDDSIVNELQEIAEANIGTDGE